MFKIVLPYVPEPIDRKKNPFRVVEVSKSKKLVQTSLFDIDEEDIEDDIVDDINTSGSYGYEDEEEYDDPGTYSSYDDDDDDFEDTTSYNDDDDTREQFDTMDAASVDWNSYDIDNIIW